MAEEEKKTEEEKLLADVAASGDAETKKDGDGEDELTPEQKLIQEYKGKFEIAEKRAESAERERDSERTQKDAARKETLTAVEKQIQANEISIANAISAAKSNFETAQKEYEEAYDAGDKKALIAAQVRLNDTQSQLRNAEFNENQFKTWKENYKAPAAPAERFLPEEKDWIRKNPWFERASSREDRAKTAAVYAANEEAISKGIKRGTSEYFNLVDSYIEDIAPSETKKEEVKKADEPVKKRETSSTAAPGTGSSGSSASSTKQKSFHMTAEHRSMVPVVFPEEYKKDPKAAEEKYAKRQLEIIERRKNGERI